MVFDTINSYLLCCVWVQDGPMELNWVISICVSGILAIVGIIFIANIIARRSGHKDSKTSVWVC